jgi:uncharacterized protein (DUF2267 family)
MLVRGFYYEGWTVSGKPGKAHKAEFLDAVEDGLGPLGDPERAVRAVFEVLARHVTAGEIEDVKHLLPKDLRSFWKHP